MGGVSRFKSRFDFRRLPERPPRLKSLYLGGSSKRFKSGSGGGLSEFCLRMIPGWYLLASGFNMGKSDEAVSEDTSLGGRLWYRISIHNTMRMKMSNSRMEAV